MEMKCIYCQNDLTLETTIETEKGFVCTNCGVPETADDTTQQPEIQEEPGYSNSRVIEEEPEAISGLELARCFGELQWVRYRQVMGGETDSVILKRPMTEILLMMEREINIAKDFSIKLDPQASIKTRYHLLSAVVYGLAYLTTHPTPHA